METTPIETSADANLEVALPTPLAPDDWASRLDSQIEDLDKPKPDPEDRPEKKPVAEKKASKTAKVPEAEKAAKVEASEKAEKSAESEKTEAKPEEAKEEAPKGLTEKAAVKWGELRAEAAKAKEYAKTIESLKAELEAAKAAPVNSEEIEQLRQINQQYEQELAISRVEATQEYKQNVIEPMVNVVGYLESLATKYELSSREMLGAFAESDPAKQSDLIADLAASMNERDRLRFYSAADDYSEIINRRDNYHQVSQERMQSIEAERQAELARHQAETEKSSAISKAGYDAAVEKVFADLKESVPVLADEEVAEEVQRLAKGDYSGADAELKAYMAHSGALLPHLLKALKSAQADLEEANQKIAGYRNSSPKAGSGSAETSRALPDDVGFLEALDQQLG